MLFFTPQSLHESQFIPNSGNDIIWMLSGYSTVDMLIERR